MSEYSEAVRDLENALKEFDETLLSIICDDNPIIETFSKDVKNVLDELNSAISEFVQYRQVEILDDILDERRLFGMCDSLISKCRMLFPKQIMYMSQKVSAVTDEHKLFLKDLNHKLLDLVNELMDSLVTVSNTIRENRTHINAFLALLKEEYRNYYKDCYRKYSIELRKETKEFKEYPGAPITEQIWGGVLGCLFSAMELAIQGQLIAIKEDDKKYAAYDKDLLTHESGLIAKLSLAMGDETLFDFEYAAEPHIDLYSELNNDNLILFFWMLMRHDMIICEMNPEQSKKLESWLKNEEHTKMNQQEPSVLFTPEAKILWKKLQDAGYVDEKYKPIKPKISLNKASVIASVMGGLLNISPLWEPFERLWNTSDLTGKYSQAKLTNYYPGFLKDIAGLL